MSAVLFVMGFISLSLSVFNFILIVGLAQQGVRLDRMRELNEARIAELSRRCGCTRRESEPSKDLTAGVIQ